MSPQTLLYIILAIITIDFLLDQILDYLNMKHQRDVLPEKLRDVYDEKEFKRSQEYHKTNAKFGFITSTFSFLLLFIVISTGFLGYLDETLRSVTEHPVWLALIFFGILFLASDIINLPFALYKNFVIEEKFGFNKMKVSTFFGDKLKGYLLGIIIGGGLLWIFLSLITELGSQFWVWFWGVVVLFMLITNMFYTSLILPLFNKLTPLPEGELRTAIEDYCKKVNFPLKNLFVIDGSKRSAKANAFFSGIGKQKKIVLYDTLVEKHTTEELVAVLAHEVGHFKKKHIISGMALSILQTGFMLFLLSLMVFSTSLSEALGADQLAFHLNLIAFGILYTPFSHLTGIFMNLFSRKNEYEADSFAAETYSAKPLITALKNLSANNLSNLTPHPAYVFMHYSHPPLVQRLDNLEKH
ncbi:M48 family metallopeptidase [Cytophagaceae bacterium ABcell3]|nr:M48 family metallopeptidase [Cytophagaceae bacterium ABcell3]